MHKSKIKFCKTKDVKTPSRGTEDAAGIDFYIPNDIGYLLVKPGESVCIKSGIRNGTGGTNTLHLTGASGGFNQIVPGRRAAGGAGGGHSFAIAGNGGGGKVFLHLLSCKI